MKYNFVDQDAYCSKCRKEVILTEKHICESETEDSIASVRCMEASKCLREDCQFIDGEVAYIA